MTAKDIRWVQRLSHFSKVLGQLARFIAKGELNELEKQGLIQSFEYTYELAWNTLKDYFEDQGEAAILGSRDAFRLAFKRGLIQDGDTWMDMVKSRTLSSHTYNEDILAKITGDITRRYFAEFNKLHDAMQALKKNLP